AHLGYGAIEGLNSVMGCNQATRAIGMSMSYRSRWLGIWAFMAAALVFAMPASAQPDLVVTSISGSCNANGSIAVSVTVRNQGSTTAGSFHVGIYVSTD